MELKSFYVPVAIFGTALVYARSKKEAIELLNETRPMVAGNKMRDHQIDFNEEDVKES